jgi:hypothetical protein
MEIGHLYYIENNVFNEKFIVKIVDNKIIKAVHEGKDTIFKIRWVNYLYCCAGGRVICLNRKSLPILKHDKIYLLEHESEMLGIVL